MDLLIVTHDYAPVNSPRAFRWTAIAEQWAAEGHSVEVVCGPVTGRRGVEERRGVRVYYVGLPIADTLRGLLGRDAQPKAGAPQGSAVGIGGRIGRLVAWIAKRLHDLTWKQVYWPDYSALWIPPAWWRVRKLLDEGPQRRLVTVSLPFSAHVVGLFARRRQPELCWLADFGDPFSLIEESASNNLALYGRLNRRVEEAVVGAADAVAVTNRAAAELYAREFSLADKTLEVVPPLLTVPHARPTRNPSPTLSRPRRLLYVGTLYREIRPPDHLLALFNALLRSTGGEPPLELHFVGDTADCGQSFKAYKGLLGTQVHLHGRVPRERVGEFMREADVLVNIGNSTPYQLPSKLVEYASTGLPILNLIQSKEDSSLAFLDDYPRLMTVPSDDVLEPEHIQSVIQLLIAGPESPEDAQRIEAWLECFRVGSIADAYMQLLNKRP